MRKWLLLGWLGILLSAICYIFWHNELVYSLPTPVPKNHSTINIGEKIELQSRLPFKKSKPVFIHFFNPNCPCSRFNMPHVKTLIEKYHSDFNFVVVLLHKDGEQAVEKVKAKYDLDVPVVCDSSIAALCGVYATPQAVILDEQQRLYYRGNYNKSRYCTEKNSMYAQMAIDSFLQQHHSPSFNPLALKAYGCELPVCTK